MKIGWSKIVRLWGYLRPYWHLELLIFAVMILLTGMMMALPLAVKYLIDDLIPALVNSDLTADSIWKVVYFGLFLLGIYFFQVVFSYIRDYLATSVGAHIIADFRSQLFSHLERLSLSFFQKHQVGEIMSRILSDVSRIQNLLITTLLIFLMNILMIIFFMTYLLYTNWMLTLVAIVPVPLTIWLAGKYGHKLHFISKRLQETIAALSARIQESLVSIKTIKAFGGEKRELTRVNGIQDSLIKLYIKNGVTNSLARNLVTFVNMAGPIVVLSWGTYLIAGGTMKLGTLMAFYMFLTYLYSPIQDLAGVHIEVQTAMASVNRLFEYLDIEPDIKEAEHPVSIKRVNGEIRLDKVDFQYNENGFALKDFNLAIAAREKVAIVGPSGSGKTTVIGLVMRFFDPQNGQVTIDGIDVKRLALDSLRANISLVDQDPMLFKTSIFNNIVYSDPYAGIEDVVASARVANIHNFISGLPNRYDTEVGERGVNLSGGEKQRICLARAILKNPPILILDEATSALDSKSESLIQDALKEILKDKTAIIIAHRLSTVHHADRIVVINEGRIVDEGTHEQLMRSSPLYQELARKQLQV